jgi:hypothetical protein
MPQAYKLKKQRKQAKAAAQAETEQYRLQGETSRTKKLAALEFHGSPST